MFICLALLYPVTSATVIGLFSFQIWAVLWLDAEIGVSVRKTIYEHVCVSMQSKALFFIAPGS